MSSFLCSPLVLQNPDVNSTLFSCVRVAVSSRRRTRQYHGRVQAAASSVDNNVHPSQNSTRLVTFLGKGGSGKTTAAVFAAQHYAMAGLRTCLVIQGQDTTAEYLLNCKIGSSPVACNKNLSAIRLETTKMLLEPLSRLKRADSHLNVTQGVLEGVVGEELGVLPGMDAVFAALSLERLIRFFKNVSQRNNQVHEFDIVINDGISSEDTLRMIGASSKARLYLKYLRSLAEKTDFGRLAGPSLLRLADEAMGINDNQFLLTGKMSAEIWDNLERMLERGSSSFMKPHKFGCFLVMNPQSHTSLSSALRYWGCAVQASTWISGAFGIAPSHTMAESMEKLNKNLSPLPFAFMPEFSMSSPLNWNSIMLTNDCKKARDLLSLEPNEAISMVTPVKFDAARKSITLLMPGFDKSEIKLYQYRGGSELLVEAGDQRRVICLPPEIQGKVAGAKFVDRSLIITIR